MPADRISSSSSLIETMRALARDRAKEAGRNGGVSTTASPPQGDGAAANPDRMTELRQRLHALARRVDVHDAQSLADARAPALREILLWEFGSDFRKDSQFLPMLDAISKTLDIDPKFGDRFARLMADMKK